MTDEQQLQLETPREPYGQALDHSCPRCGAGAGELCRTANGQPAATEHATRLKHAVLRKEKQ